MKLHYFICSLLCMITHIYTAKPEIGPLFVINRLSPTEKIAVILKYKGTINKKQKHPCNLKHNTQKLTKKQLYLDSSSKQIEVLTKKNTMNHAQSSQAAESEQLSVAPLILNLSETNKKLLIYKDDNYIYIDDETGMVGMIEP